LEDFDHDPLEPRVPAADGAMAGLAAGTAGARREARIRRQVGRIAKARERANLGLENEGT
jgi:hypothetical protein